MCLCVCYVWCVGYESAVVFVGYAVCVMWCGMYCVLMCVVYACCGVCGMCVVCDAGCTGLVWFTMWCVKYTLYV